MKIGGREPPGWGGKREGEGDRRVGGSVLMVL